MSRGQDRFLVELLQIALCRRESMSAVLTDGQWVMVYASAEKQAVLGIAFSGLSKICKLPRTDADRMFNESHGTANIPRSLFCTWMGNAVLIQQRNELVSLRCVELSEKLKVDGQDACILKGQGVGSFYGSLALYRQSGDIDVWMYGGQDKVMSYVSSQTGPNNNWDYSHISFPIFDDVEVEMHYRPSFICNLFLNRKLQKYYRANENPERHMTVSLGDAGEIRVPFSGFNALFLMLHIYKHLFYEGVGLRQFMDLYFVLLESPFTGGDRDELRRMIDSFGIKKFASGTMWLMKNVFFLEDERLVCEPDERQGRFLLGEVFASGNFGQSDRRVSNKSKGKWHSISAILRHDMYLFGHYPREVLWIPVWMLYHLIWKKYYKRSI